MAKMRVIVLQVEITVPVTVGESEVERELNAALDEPPCDWGNWTVGAVSIVGVGQAYEDDDSEL